VSEGVEGKKKEKKKRVKDEIITALVLLKEIKKMISFVIKKMN